MKESAHHLVCFHLCVSHLVKQPRFNCVMHNSNPVTYCEQRQPREDHEGNADGSDHHQPPLGEGDGQGYFEIIPGCVK